MTARSSRTGPHRSWSPPAVASPRCTRRGRTPCDSYRHPACRRPVVRGVVHSGELDADAARWLSAALLTLVGFGRLSIRLCAGAGVVGWQEIGRGRLGREMALGLVHSTRCPPPGGCGIRRTLRKCSSLPLSCAQAPWPLSMLVGPPVERGTMWSLCRIAALQNGPRQLRSRQRRKRARADGKTFAFDSTATSSPLVGWVYKRRSTARTVGPSGP